jgi:hypothetical protein
MTSYPSLLISAILINLLSLTQAQQPAVTQASQGQITPGTFIQVELNSDIDVKKARPGDQFKATLWEDLRSGGKVVLPKKTVIVGHVIAAQPRSKDNPDSQLAIAFDKALLKSGAEVPFEGVIERVQLTPMAVAAGAGTDPSYNRGLNPGSTTNIAMPNASADSPQQGVTPGPTNVRDSSVTLKPDPAGKTTLITSANKAEVKLKRYSTLDVQITHSGQ